ncbi:MAG: hypothetical protein AAB373_04575 [Patescibacteria group bacterium]
MADSTDLKATAEKLQAEISNLKKLDQYLKVEESSYSDKQEIKKLDADLSSI